MALRKGQGRTKRKSNRAANGSINNGVQGLPRTVLSPQQVAVAFGLLTRALTVDSVLIDKNRNIQFVVGGDINYIEDLLEDLGITLQDLTKLF